MLRFVLTRLRDSQLLPPSRLMFSVFGAPPKNWEYEHCSPWGFHLRPTRHWRRLLYCGLLVPTVPSSAGQMLAHGVDVLLPLLIVVGLLVLATFKKMLSQRFQVLDRHDRVIREFTDTGVRQDDSVQWPEIWLPFLVAMWFALLVVLAGSRISDSEVRYECRATKATVGAGADAVAQRSQNVNNDSGGPASCPTPLAEAAVPVVTAELPHACLTCKAQSGEWVGKKKSVPDFSLVLIYLIVAGVLAIAIFAMLNHKPQLLRLPDLELFVRDEISSIDRGSLRLLVRHPDSRKRRQMGAYYPTKDWRGVSDTSQRLVFDALIRKLLVETSGDKPSLHPTHWLFDVYLAPVIYPVAIILVLVVWSYAPSSGAVVYLYTSLMAWAGWAVSCFLYQYLCGMRPGTERNIVGGMPMWGDLASLEDGLNKLEERWWLTRLAVPVVLAVVTLATTILSVAGAVKE